MTDDQRTPDLDAAIDATVRALTSVSDDAAADSLRRARIALADAAPRRSGLGAWGWPVTTMAMTAALVAVMLWRPWTPAVSPRVVGETRPPAVSTPVPSAPAPRTTAPVAAASVPKAPSVRPTRAVRTRRGPTPAPVIVAPLRPDPLADLIAAVQQIPEDAWTESRVRVERPVIVAETTLAPITVTDLDTPSISTLPPDPIAPGEP